MTAYGQKDTNQSELISKLLGKLSPKNQANIQKIHHYFEIHFIQIDRNNQGIPKFTAHHYNGGERTYFNPASLVKLPLVLMTLEKLESLGIDKFTRYQTRNQTNCVNQLEPQKNSLEGFYNMANDIRKILLVSDNTSYNVLFDFLGQAEITRKLQDKNYSSTRIIRRFLNCSVEENAYSNPFWFYNSANKLVYEQKESKNSEPILLAQEDVFVGKGYKEGNKIVNKPKNFRLANYHSLEDATTMLKSLIFPESVAPERRWQISRENREFVLRYMTLLPRQSGYADYRNPKKFDDTYKKLLIYGNQRQIADELYNQVKSINMIGFTFGFISDVAYIVDFENGVDFFLTIGMYANTDNLIDGSYNYHDIARPFFAEFGRIVLDHEKNRIEKKVNNFSGLQKIVGT